MSRAAKPTAPEAENPIVFFDPLYNALESRMKDTDDKSRPDRVRALLGRLETLLGTGVPAGDASVAPASSDLLGMDPGEAAVGRFGFFWDGSALDVSATGICDEFIPTSMDKYSCRDGADFQHFLEARVEVHPKHMALFSVVCK